MRYFRTPDANTYEAIRADLDQAYGYPNAATKTVTAIAPSDVAVTDLDGRKYMAASEAECEYPAISDRLPALLASGAVTEITEAQYRSALPESPSPVS
jgi:hypothetical protein